MNMMTMATMESPALNGVSEHWLEKWGRVPKRVLMLRTALPDHILVLVKPKWRGLAAVKGQEYPVWVNSHGAVSAVLPGGHRLGLYPAEFEVVEFHELRACDYGAPTIRKRLFLIAKRGKGRIVWPEPTHGPGRPEPYRTAADCIDCPYPVRPSLIAKSLWPTRPCAGLPRGSCGMWSTIHGRSL